MSLPEPKKGMERRTFIKQAACRALGVTALVNSMSHVFLMNKALAQQPAFGDYKALVILFLYGGNDSNNMLIPTAANSSARAAYTAARGVLGIADSLLSTIAVPGAGGSQFGLHPNLAPLAALFNAGDLSFVTNVGTLVEPIGDNGSREDYNSGLFALPRQLFSHSDQALAWQASVGNNAFTSGWGGRIADHFEDDFGGNRVSLSISMAGFNNVQVGKSVAQYALNPLGIESFNEAGYDFPTFGSTYTEIANGTGALDSNKRRRLKAFSDLLGLSYDQLFAEEYKDVVNRAITAEGFVTDAINAAEAAQGGPTGPLTTNFSSVINTDLGRQLKMVARLIAGRDQVANERQIFFCGIGGYDTHANQIDAHNGLYTELASALAAFNQTMRDIGTHDKVLTVSGSDFARSLSANKDIASIAGTDHGWGGHQFVMGGPVDGGKIFGTFPNLTLRGPSDQGDRGRWIPTTSVDQYHAVAASWMGIGPADWPTVFPNVGRFDNPLSPDSGINFLQA